MVVQKCGNQHRDNESWQCSNSAMQHYEEKKCFNVFILFFEIKSKSRKITSTQVHNDVAVGDGFTTLSNLRNRQTCRGIFKWDNRDMILNRFWSLLNFSQRFWWFLAIRIWGFGHFFLKISLKYLTKCPLRIELVEFCTE